MKCPFIKDHAKLQNVKSVMKQTCAEIYHLLQGITYNFKINGINYNATEFYKVVVRIITPFELLSQHHIIDNEALSFGATEANKNLQSTLLSNSFRPSKVSANPFVNEPKNSQNLPMRSRSGPPSSQSKISELVRSQISPASFPIQRPIKVEPSEEGNETTEKFYKNRLDPEMEKKVYLWTLNCYKMGKRVQMSDICRYAKSVSKNKLFQASSGWCANFLKRHLDICALVKTKHVYEPHLDPRVESYLSRYSQNQLPPKMSVGNQEPLPFKPKQKIILEKKKSKRNEVQQDNSKRKSQILDQVDPWNGQHNQNEEEDNQDSQDSEYQKQIFEQSDNQSQIKNQESRQSSEDQSNS